MPDLGPAPHVALRPLAARWFARRVSIRELREAAVHARSQGRPDVAEQLEEASEQLRHVAAWAGRASVGGNAEAVTAEVVACSESSSSLDTAVVAGLLGVTDSRVRQLIRSGALSATRLGRGWLIDRATVEEYLLLRSSA